MAAATRSRLRSSAGAVRGARPQHRRLRAGDAGRPAPVHGHSRDGPRPPPGDSTEESPRAARTRWAVAALAASALVFGIGSRRSFQLRQLRRASQDSHDCLTPRRELLIRAQKVHPLDYFYALEEARFEPARGSARHAVARASTRSTARCASVRPARRCTLEVARNLWHFGLRPQALLEWRTAVDLQPSLFTAALGELFSTGAKPQELAAVASSRSDTCWSW